MNKLYTFGCSVTENLNNLPDWSPRIKYANEYCGGLYKTWPEILGDKLKMETHNYAALSSRGKFDFNISNSNEDIFEALSLVCGEFKSSDVVIVQFTNLMRFRYVNKFKDFDVILPSHVDSYAEKQSLIDMLKNKSNPKFIRPLINAMNPFFELSKKVGFDLWFWSNDDDIQKHMIPLNNSRWLFDENINELLPKLNAHPIAVETNHEIEDYHLAQPGQEILAELIYQRIKK